MKEAPYVATLEIPVWEWEHDKAADMFKNLVQDIAKLSHRTEGASHALAWPTRMELRRNPLYQEPT